MGEGKQSGTSFTKEKKKASMKIDKVVPPLQMKKEGQRQSRWCLLCKQESKSLPDGSFIDKTPKLVSNVSLTPPTKT